MVEEVENFIKNNQLLSFEKPVILGVSGGVDSVVMLDILYSLGFKCIVAHCNFHLRAEDADSDEKFVENIAIQYKIPYYKVDFLTREYASETKISIEMAARELRYNWFNKLAADLDAGAIAVAHHADDNIETLLMNLTRGTGLRGLCGIPLINGRVVRPLLCCSRNEIEEYCSHKGLKYVVDVTNQDSVYTRNKFRNKVIPLLEEINPSVRQTLYNTVLRFEGINSVFQQAIESIRDKIVEKTEDLIKINIPLLKNQIAIPTILFEILNPYNFGFQQVEQIINQLDATSGKLFFSNTHRLVKDREFLYLTKLDDSESSIYLLYENENSIEIPIPLHQTIFTKKNDFIISKERKKIQVDKTKLNYPLILRKWKEGDSFFPFGMKSRKKLSDFFIDNKISIVEKEKVWLLISGEDIVWVIGYRLDNRYKISDDATEIVQFEI